MESSKSRREEKHGSLTSTALKQGNKAKQWGRIINSLWCITAFFENGSSNFTLDSEHPWVPEKYTCQDIPWQCWSRKFYLVAKESSHRASTAWTGGAALSFTAERLPSRRKQRFVIPHSRAAVPNDIHPSGCLMKTEAPSENSHPVWKEFHPCGGDCVNEAGRRRRDDTGLKAEEQRVVLRRMNSDWRSAQWQLNDLRVVLTVLTFGGPYKYQDERYTKRNTKSTQQMKNYFTKWLQQSFLFHHQPRHLR
ncbi:hypothetical protein EYF80_020431 [Liparis tanakae]|uniref:Uncharacterized protein n=1 Tax=Liparis tanakae TaxID=230148 RepID=A0A4Z2HUG0_9TELE|nr:hypothetical protein EYF80_020431 [Liparis tanakae]